MEIMLNGMPKTTSDLADIDGVAYEVNQLDRSDVMTCVLSKPSDHDMFINRRGFLVTDFQKFIDLDFTEYPIIQANRFAFSVASVKKLKRGDYIAVEVTDVEPNKTFAIDPTWSNKILVPDDWKPREHEFTKILAIQGRTIMVSPSLKKYPVAGGYVIKYFKASDLKVKHTTYFDEKAREEADKQRYKRRMI